MKSPILHVEIHGCVRSPKGERCKKALFCSLDSLYTISSYNFQGGQYFFSPYGENVRPPT